MPEGDSISRPRPKRLGGARGPTVTKAYVNDQGILSIAAQQLALTGAEELTDPYKESAWVHACIKALAQALSQAPPKLYRGDPLVDQDSAEELSAEHPVAKLLNAPNDHQSATTFREADLIHRKLDGETVWFLMDQTGAPVVREMSARARAPIPLPAIIVPVRGNAVEIERAHHTGLPLAYVYPSRAKTKFPAASVVHFRDYDPSEPFRGLGDVETLLRDLAQEFAAHRYQEGLLGNGGDPGGWLISETALSPETRRAQQAKTDDLYSNPKNAGAWHLIDGTNMKVQPNTMRPKDMEYVTLLDRIRDKIAGILGVPLPLLGVLDNATYNNLDHARRLLWIGPNGVISYLRSVEDTINTFFLPRVNADTRNVFLRHDLSGVRELQEDLSSALKVSAEVAALGVGVSFNDAARLNGIDSELPDAGEIAFMPVGRTTLAALLANPMPDDDPADDEPEPSDDSDDEPESGKAYHATAARTYADDVNARLEPQERRAHRVFKRYLRDYEEAQLKRLEAFAASGPQALAHGGRELRNDAALVTRASFDDLTEQDLIDLLLDPEEWAEKLMGASTPVIHAAFVAGVADITEEFGFSFVSMESPTVLSALESHVIRLAGDVNGTLAKRVQRELLKTLSGVEGANITTLQEAVDSVLPELRGSLRTAFGARDQRALAIARTETNKATGIARDMTMRENGVLEHQWWSSGDEAVRDSHRDLDGQIRKLGDEFKPGLKFPLDPDGPAEEVVNCRCKSRPIIKD